MGCIGAETIGTDCSPIRTELSGPTHRAHASCLARALPGMVWRFEAARTCALKRTGCGAGLQAAADSLVGCCASLTEQAQPGLPLPCATSVLPLTAEPGKSLVHSIALPNK